MTSSNGNIFRVTGHLCGEFTGLRWIPRTKASDAELWFFSLICARINGWINNGEAGDLRRHCAHYNVIVMSTCIESQHAMLPSVSHLAADDSHRNCRFSRLLEHTPDVDHRKWVITVSGKISSSDVNLSNTIKSHLCIESLSWYVLNYECQKYIHINLDHKDTKCLSWK